MEIGISHIANRPIPWVSRWLTADGKAVALTSAGREKKNNDSTGDEGGSCRDHAADKICAASRRQDRSAACVSQLRIFLSQVHARRLPRYDLRTDFRSQ